jgi:di/tricarboxylate transporter
MSVMSIIIKSSNIPRADAIKIGFTVFAASVPVSLVFFTGDASISVVAAGFAGGMTFVQWFINMGVPALIASILTMLLIFILFRPTKEITINKAEIRDKLATLGPMSAREVKTILWVALAIILWLTDSVHGIDLGWVALIIGGLLAFPFIGGVLTPKDWSSVPVQTLMFVTAAMSIGSIGAATGMNDWLANTFLTGIGQFASSSPFIFYAILTVIALILHMLLGSSMSVMSIAVPTILAVTTPLGINPIAPTLIVYAAIYLQYLLPYQHINILVGANEDVGGFTQKETLRLGFPLIIVVFIVTLGVMVPWLSLLGTI